MAVRYHDLADLITNTFCALLGITTVRPAFYSQFAASKYKWQNHQCEDTLLLLMKLLKAENQGSARHTLESLPAKLKEYVDIEKRSGLTSMKAMRNSQSFARFISGHLSSMSQKPQGKQNCHPSAR
jgi:hypothetical protein